MPHKIDKSMGEFKRKTLTTRGRKVTSRKQAIAIGLSQDRKAHKGTKQKKKR